MQLDHYRSLGRSGLHVSPFCLGAMTFGEETGIGTTPEISKQMIDRYIDLGGNFIDTANGYTRGHSEKILGDHIGRHPAKRNRLVIATKFSANLHYRDPNGGGSSRKSLIAACEQSLRRLQTDYIDLYWQHWMDVYTPIEETWRALDDLVTSGKVRYIGMSDSPAWKVVQAQMTAQMRGWAPVVALQLEYSLIERTIEGELVPAVKEFGLGLTPWSPLAGGALTGKYRRGSNGAEDSLRRERILPGLRERQYDIIEKTIEIAQKRGTTPARIALAWVLAQPGVSSPIIGARTMAQLDDNLAALELELAPEDLAELGTVSKPKLNFPAGILSRVESFSHGGLHLNGRDIPAGPLTIGKDEKVY